TLCGRRCGGRRGRGPGVKGLLSQFGRWRAGRLHAGLSYNAVAGQIGRSRCRQASRKVRTPSGAIAANGRPAIPSGKAEEQGHRDETAARVGRKARTGTAISVLPVRFVRAGRGRVKRRSEERRVGKEGRSGQWVAL